MGGEAGVANEPGHGSCFWAELPLPAWAPPAAAAVTAPALAEPPPAGVDGVHVLVVDDDEVNRMIAVAQLEQLGARVGVAGDGQQALDAVAAAAAAGDPYALVLMDVQMPLKSGFEVTRELRRRFSAEQLPIVAHTAAALVGEREAAFAAGMNDFLPKPSTDAELMRAIVARWSARVSPA
jgi:CheY-like chemotaxis protein